MRWRTQINKAMTRPALCVNFDHQAPRNALTQDDTHCVTNLRQQLNVHDLRVRHRLSFVTVHTYSLACVTVTVHMYSLACVTVHTYSLACVTVHRQSLTVRQSAHRQSLAVRQSAHRQSLVLMQCLSVALCSEMSVHDTALRNP